MAALTKRPPRVVALLFGRAGSVGVPRKNVEMILGRPSLFYPLMAATASGVVDELFVSSDSEEILRLARPFGVQAIERPAHLATNEALLEDAIAHGFEVVDRMTSGSVDYYLILLCNAVTLLPDEIRRAYDMLRGDPQADSVATGAKWNMFSPVRARVLDAATGLLRPYVPTDLLSHTAKIICDRDMSGDCYFCNHSFTLVRREALVRLRANDGPFRWMGNRIRLIEQLPGSGDVDLPWQVPTVEWWLRVHGFTDITVPYPLPQPCPVG